MLFSSLCQPASLQREHASSITDGRVAHAHALTGLCILEKLERHPETIPNLPYGIYRLKQVFNKQLTLYTFMFNYHIVIIVKYYSNFDKHQNFILITGCTGNLTPRTLQQIYSRTITVQHAIFFFALPASTFCKVMILLHTYSKLLVLDYQYVL